MLLFAFVGAALFAQSTATVQIGAPRIDSARTKRADSVEIRREMRRDSLRATAARRDSARRARRRARQITVTPAHIASAFKDAQARSLLMAARVARLEQDTTLRGYDATAYERISAKVGLRRIGPKRLLYRREKAMRIVWSRGNPTYVQVLGSRAAYPVEGVRVGLESDDLVPFPYLPGRETLWIGSGLAKPDVADSELIHPLAAGAEAYYTYATGDSVSFQLPGRRRISIRELLVRPRLPRWNVAVGSLWFDVGTAHLVRAAYRLAEPLDVWAMAEMEEEDDPPPGWVKGMITPLTGQINSIAVEYGLHEGRFWLPRVQSLEGTVRAGFVTMPLKLEQNFRYANVNGTSPVPVPQVTVSDTATDSVSRARRVEAAREACARGTTRRRVVPRWSGGPPTVIQIPCDTALLMRSAELPVSIYDEGEEFFETKEIESLIDRALSLGAQPGWMPQKPVGSYGLARTRYNRIEGVSSAIAVHQALGAGYTAHAQLRIGVADLSPNAELGLTRSNNRQSIGINAFRRLSTANDWGNPLSFGSSLGALLFGRDEGFYYRSTGIELTGTHDDSLTGAWRLFAEHHGDAVKKTDFSIAKAMGGSRFLDNIDARNGEVLGAAIERYGTLGMNPRRPRLFSVARVEGAFGSFDYVRAMVDATLSKNFSRYVGAALTAAAGTSGGTVPAQRMWYLGGTQTVRGQRAGAASGDAFWMTRAELGLGRVLMRPVLFADMGWAGSREDWRSPGRPLSGAGVGASLLDGLVRFDVAKGIYPERKVRANVYLEARF